MTPERALVLKELLEQKHPWMQFVDGFTRGGYGTWGGLAQWLTILYWATGDESYARRAIEDLLPAIRASKDTSDRNSTRESSFYWALEYMWLKAHMTPEEDAEYRAFLFQWAASMFGRGNQGIFTLPEDSDEVVGHYFGLRLIGKAVEHDFSTYAPGGSSIGMPRMRERIRDFCKMAEGGEWIESSEYNLGTLQLLIIGAHFVGMDEFPEVKALLPQIAEQLCWTLTPDLKDSAQWGDEQGPHSLHLNNRVALMAILCGLGYGGDDLLHTLAALIKDRPIYPDFWAAAYRALWFFDPRTLPEFPVAGSHIGLRVAQGQGLCIYSDIKTFLQVQMQPPPKPLYVDHTLQGWGDIRLWMNGEWVLDHPLGYGAYPSAGNVCLLGGLGVMDERQILTTQGFDSGCVIAGRVHGPRHETLKELAFADWDRIIDYSAPGHIKVRDHFVGREPFSIERYSQQDREQIEARLGLWVQLWHAPVEPTQTTSGFTWMTPGGQRVTLTSNASDLFCGRHIPGTTLIGNFHPDQVTGWRIAFISNDPTATIETTLTIGDVQPEPEPEQTLEQRVARLEQAFQGLKEFASQL